MNDVTQTSANLTITVLKVVEIVLEVLKLVLEPEITPEAESVGVGLGAGVSMSAKRSVGRMDTNLTSSWGEVSQQNKKCVDWVVD